MSGCASPAVEWCRRLHTAATPQAALNRPRILRRQPHRGWQCPVDPTSTLQSPGVSCQSHTDAPTTRYCMSYLRRWSYNPAANTSYCYVSVRTSTMLALFITWWLVSKHRRPSPNLTPNPEPDTRPVSFRCQGIIGSKSIRLAARDQRQNRTAARTPDKYLDAAKVLIGFHVPLRSLPI